MYQTVLIIYLQYRLWYTIYF